MNDRPLAVEQVRATQTATHLLDYYAGRRGLVAGLALIALVLAAAVVASDALEWIVLSLLAGVTLGATLVLIAQEGQRSSERRTDLEKRLSDRSGADGAPAASIGRSRLLPGPIGMTAGKVVLLPSADYHTDEFGPLAEQLRVRGIESVIVVNAWRWPLVEAGMSRHEFPVLEAPDVGPWLGEVAAVVTMNDWGEYYHQYVIHGNEVGIPTIAKVEGVQDFDDDDVPFRRDAYRRSAFVLAQGQNDVDALPEKDCQIVGSSRLEQIWLGPPRPYRGDLAVINLNFTYGVLEDARESWLTTAVEGCESAGIPYVVSLHPAERNRYEGRLPIADHPMRQLLMEASVLISRFSTVPFEAMARGVPFVYHNPHGERVPTFATPDGAFETSDDVSSLAAAVKASQPWVGNYRERAANFFLRQIDVDADRPSEVRGAEAITTILTDGR